MTWLKEGHVGKQRDTPKDLLGPCVNVHCMAHVWLYEMGSFFQGKVLLPVLQIRFTRAFSKQAFWEGRIFSAFEVQGHSGN